MTYLLRLRALFLFVVSTNLTPNFWAAHFAFLTDAPNACRRCRIVVDFVTIIPLAFFSVQ